MSCQNCGVNGETGVQTWKIYCVALTPWLCKVYCLDVTLTLVMKLEKHMNMFTVHSWCIST